MKHKSLLVLTVCLLSANMLFTKGYAQKKDLTYKQVFSYGEPRLTKSLPRITGWLDNDNYLEFRNINEKKLIMKVNATSNEESVYLDYEKYNKLLPEGFTLEKSVTNTVDYKKFILRNENKLFYFNLPEEEFIQITDADSEEKNVTFSPDNGKVAFTRNHDLYVIDLKSGNETRLTNDGNDSVYNGWASWVYYEEILGRPSQYRAFWWSPDSKKLAYLRFDDKPVPDFTLFRAEGIHGELEVTPYPKAGDPNPVVYLGVADIESSETVWLDKKTDPDRYVAWPFWTTDSENLVYQYMPRDQDEITFFKADPETGEKTKIYHEKQESWIDFFEDLYFFEDGSGFLVRSDKDGWRNIYYYDLSGNLIEKVTDFDWRVTGISKVIEKEKTVYFTGTGSESTENHLFRIKLDGTGLEKLTHVKGTHRVNLSPDAKFFIDTYSNIEFPFKMELFNFNGKKIRSLGNSKSEMMDEYNLGKVELFTIPTSDGWNLPAKWTLPPDFDNTKKYPVIFSIYGGPDAATVRNSAGYSLSNHYYAQHGIITLSVDHRGSGHFGKEGMAFMHRNLGKWETHDYIETVKWLKDKPFIDTNKIGITGGSYGGYMTLMCLTAGADYFTHGIARSAVTTWRLYDNVYTERYMDTPDQNPDGYKYGSVMTHAENYKGELLITHGTMDDNVHMQHVIQLISKMEDLNKDFEFMLYPGGRHGWGGAKRAHSTKESVQFWFKHFLEKELKKEIKIEE